MKSFYFDNNIKIMIPNGWEEEKGDSLVSLYDPVEGV